MNWELHINNIEQVDTYMQPAWWERLFDSSDILCFDFSCVIQFPLKW